MGRKRDYETLWNDVQELQKQYPTKARQELFPYLRKLGWNLTHYKKIFFDVLEMKNFLDCKKQINGRFYSMLEFAKTLKIEMKSHEEENWRETTLEDFLQSVKLTRDIIIQTEDIDHNPDEYTEDRALWNIRTGRIVDTPVLMYRLAEGIECPKCGNKFQDRAGALSRRDNKTKICSNCGTREAIEDFNKNK